ncbi:MAG TPA: HAD family hydrolase, partial [Chloroflexota bacterium]|nr:HAD family hydrolase [Chloroflexota bacterium]
MSTRYRAAFFDVGETLVYAHPSPAEIMAGICAESGLDVGVSRIEAAESVVGPRILQKQAGQAPHELYSISRENSERFWLWVYDEILGALEIPPARRPALAGRFHERFSTLETWRLFPDAVPTLEVLQERRRGDGLVVGVVSNWEDWLETLLIRLEID